jgi:hypothetical protein
LVLLFFVLWFPGWFVADHVRKSPFVKRIPHALALLSVPITIGILCVCLLALQNTEAPNDVFGLVTYLLYAPALAITVFDPGRRPRAAQFIKQYWPCLLLSALVAICAIAYVGVGLDRLDGLKDWQRVARRNLHELPTDNDLSFRASRTWRDHAGVTRYFVNVWEIGERGPLLAALHSFLFRAFEPRGDATFAGYERLGIVLNSLYVIPLWLWLSAVVGRRAAWLCVAVVGLSPWLFFNLYYTWPKLFEAYFLIVAMCLLFRRPAPTDPATFAVAGALCGLAGLAHPGGLLSVPVLYGVAVITSWRSRGVVVRSLAMPLALLIVIAPWQVYKSSYSPDNGGMFAANFLGAKNELPMRDNIQRFFRDHGLAEQISTREEYVKELWWKDIDGRLIADFWKLRGDGGALYGKEFFSPLYSAGLIWFSLLIVALPIHWMRQRAFRHVPGGSGFHGRTAALLQVVAFVTISLTINAAIRWRPPFSHELPYAELVLLAGLFALALARLGTIYIVLAACAVIDRQFFYFRQTATNGLLRLPAFDHFGLLFWVMVIATFAAARLVTEIRRSPEGILNQSAEYPATDQPAFV